MPSEISRRGLKHKLSEFVQHTDTHTHFIIQSMIWSWVSPISEDIILGRHFGLIIIPQLGRQAYKNIIINDVWLVLFPSLITCVSTYLLLHTAYHNEHKDVHY